MCGGGWSWCNIDWAATAAWAQAILAAAAVFLAAALQDRAIRRREAADRNRRFESAAAVARYALATYEKTAKRAEFDGMDPQQFLGVYRKPEFEAAIRAIQTIPVVTFGDGALTEAFVRLETSMTHAAAELLAAQAQVQSAMIGKAVPAATIVQGFRTDIFNAAASVERRAAHLIGRPATL